MDNRCGLGTDDSGASDMQCPYMETMVGCGHDAMASVPMTAATTDVQRYCTGQ